MARQESKTILSEQNPTPSPQGLRDLDFRQASLAYSIIQTLLEHTRVTNDLIAMIAQVLDHDTTKALTATPYWSAYLDSRRAMERARADLEKFVEEMNRLRDENGSATLPPA